MGDFFFGAGEAFSEGIGQGLEIGARASEAEKDRKLKRKGLKLDQKKFELIKQKQEFTENQEQFKKDKGTAVGIMMGQLRSQGAQSLFDENVEIDVNAVQPLINRHLPDFSFNTAATVGLTPEVREQLESEGNDTSKFKDNTKITLFKDNSDEIISIRSHQDVKAMLGGFFDGEAQAELQTMLEKGLLEENIKNLQAESLSTKMSKKGIDIDFTTARNVVDGKGFPREKVKTEDIVQFDGKAHVAVDRGRGGPELIPLIGPIKKGRGLVIPGQIEKIDKLKAETKKILADVDRVKVDRGKTKIELDKIKAETQKILEETKGFGVKREKTRAEADKILADIKGFEGKRAKTTAETEKIKEETKQFVFKRDKIKAEIAKLNQAIDSGDSGELAKSVRALQKSALDTVNTLNKLFQVASDDEMTLLATVLTGTLSAKDAADLDTSAPIERISDIANGKIIANKVVRDNAIFFMETLETLKKAQQAQSRLTKKTVERIERKQKGGLPNKIVTLSELKKRAEKRLGN